MHNRCPQGKVKHTALSVSKTLTCMLKLVLVKQAEVSSENVLVHRPKGR